jgi:hypothetical protein
MDGQVLVPVLYGIQPGLPGNPFVLPDVRHPLARARAFHLGTTGLQTGMCAPEAGR